MHNRGFTLVEVLIAMGVCISLISAGLVITVNEYRGEIARAEEETIVMLLKSARSEAMSNISGTPHGVAINPPDYPHAYVVFEGAEYDPLEGEILAQEYALDLTASSLSAVVFEQLSGDAREPGSVLFVDSLGMEREIEINAEGRIDWHI